MPEKLAVSLHWRTLGDETGADGWSFTCALYAYLAPRSPEVLYIGKADGCSVRERWRQKEAFWRDLENQRRLRTHRAIVAQIAVPEGARLTRELLADIESLLIHQVKPWGNIQSVSSRIQRPGLVVRCSGSWPLSQRVFRDE